MNMLYIQNQPEIKELAFADPSIDIYTRAFH
jgi:hypothetical protein